MTTIEPTRPAARPGFGAATLGESRLRAVAGGTISTALVVAGFCSAGFEGSFLLLLATAGLAGSALAWLVERRCPSTWPEVRYAVVGALLAGAVLLVLGWPDHGLLLVALLVALPAGAAGGAVAGLVAARLPARLLPAAVGVGVVVLAGAGGVAVERTLPWLSDSYLLVEGPSTAGSAGTLAERAAQGLRAEPDPLSDAAWGEVASRLVTTRPGGQVRIGDDRGANRRRIIVRVDGDQACVDVRGGQVESYLGDCTER